MIQGCGAVPRPPPTWLRLARPTVWAPLAWALGGQAAGCRVSGPHGVGLPAGRTRLLAVQGPGLCWPPTTPAVPARLLQVLQAKCKRSELHEAYHLPPGGSPGGWAESDASAPRYPQWVLRQPQQVATSPGLSVCGSQAALGRWAWSQTGGHEAVRSCLQLWPGSWAGSGALRRAGSALDSQED